MRITFALIALLIFASCHKDKLELKANSPLIGNHNWTYSEEIVAPGSNANAEMIDLSATQDRYGLRIKKNGKAWLFKNGKVEIAGYIAIEYKGSNYDAINVIREKNGNRSFELTTYKSEFAVIGYPFENYYNFYKK